MVPLDDSNLLSTAGLITTWSEESRKIVRLGHRPIRGAETHVDQCVMPTSGRRHDALIDVRLSAAYWAVAQPNDFTRFLRPRCDQPRRR